jgi:hypothetical protein
MRFICANRIFDRLRGAVRRLAIARSLVWVDCQSRKDWLNFWDVDPLEMSGVELGSLCCQHPRR